MATEPEKREENAKRARRRGGDGRPFGKGNQAARGHGRPKISPEYKAAMRQLDPLAAQALGEILSDPSHKDRAATARYVWDRNHGPVTQRTEVSGPNGEPLKVSYDDVREKLTKMSERIANAGADEPSPDQD